MTQTYPHLLRPVISNPSPLITLTGVGLLELLPALYREIWIPQAVYSEYQVGLPTTRGVSISTRLRGYRFI